MNKNFLLGVIEASPDGTKGGFGRQYKITPSRLSNLILGHRTPTPMERQKLLKAFSPYMMRKFFPRRKPVEKIEGAEAANE